MLDENGFNRKTYAMLIEEMNDKAKELFGETINLSPRTFLGILIRLYAWFLTIIWQVMESVYNNSFPGTATGVSLDRAVKFKGLTRNKEGYSYGKIRIRGEPGNTIEAGFIVGTKRNIYFETVQDAVLDELGVSIVDIYASETGSQGNVAAGDITEILYPDPEVVFEVINLEPTSGGRDRETDSELYARYQESPSNSGSSDIESIESTLLETKGVRDAVVYQNTKSVEKDGIPAHSIAPFVFGGDDDEVARAIFAVKSGGIESFGTIIREVRDSKGQQHFVGFSRPEEVQVYVKVSLTKKSDFPSDGLKMARSQVLSYIGGKDESGTEYSGLGLNENVIQAKIVASVFALGSVEDANVQLSLDGVNYTTGNLVIASNQVAKTTFDKVAVT
ncbi:baseplate J/gp47 family protein [Peribacillus sp. B-H-3]|uniref:baseplate J/gp47 family protein n=1 Tax=Peribacillus sp. B-H-3 TaxID=3400420 RepID=UPI003B011A2D